MVVLIVAEYDYVVQIHKESLPFIVLLYNVKCSLKSHQDIRETKWHSFELERSGVKNKPSFVLILFSDIHLQISIVRIERSEVLPVTE